MKKYSNTLKDVEQYLDELIDENFVINALKNAGVYPELYYSFNFHSVNQLNTERFESLSDHTVTDTSLSIGFNNSKWQKGVKISKNYNNTIIENPSIIAA